MHYTTGQVVTVHTYSIELYLYVPSALIIPGPEALLHFLTSQYDCTELNFPDQEVKFEIITVFWACTVPKDFQNFPTDNYCAGCLFSATKVFVIDSLRPRQL
jgi:hypothetical protein